MKISPTLDIPSAGTAATSDRKAPARAGANDPQPAAGASVHLSGTSSQLVSGPSGTSFDHGKVEAIKQAIAEGKLQVHAEAVADHLIANALALSGRPPK